MTREPMTPEQLCAEIETMLAPGVAATREREAMAWDTLAGDAPLVLFGAGNLGRKLARGLAALGQPPIAFCDNNPALWGQQLLGLPVLSPAEAARQHGGHAAFVLSIWRGEGSDTMPQRIAQAEGQGLGRVLPFLPLMWKHAQAFLPHYALNLPHRLCEAKDDILATARLWADEASRREYLAQLRFRFLGDFASLPPPVAHEIYFPDDLFTPQRDDCFVDCGAYDGDTLRRYLVHAPDARGALEAFEPDPRNLAALQAWVATQPEALRQRVRVHGLAVSSTRRQVPFDATGNEAAAVGGSGAMTVPAAPLDEVLDDRTVHYLKMDTEGSEPAALVGAQRILRTQAPKLAICVYHRQDHLWSIPKLIHGYNPRYRLHLRPHLLEGWDTVCYATV